MNSVQKPLCIAHRGASGYLPENTILAFQKAIELGADGIELDVQETKDGFFVVTHDDVIRGASIKEITLKDVIELSTGSLEARIPTLDRVFSTLPLTKEITVVVDIKKVKSVDNLLELLSKQSIRMRIYAMSFDYELLKRVHSSRYDLSIGYISAHKLKNPADKLDAINASVLSLRYSLINAGVMDEVHRVQKQIYAWTVNEDHSILSLSKIGVDAIISDYPDRVAKLLKTL